MYGCDVGYGVCLNYRRMIILRVDNKRYERMDIMWVIKQGWRKRRMMEAGELEAFEGRKRGVRRM